MEEKRKYKRKDCLFKVKLAKLNHRPVRPRYNRAFGVNISPGGLRFAYLGVFKKRDKVKLIIEKIEDLNIKPVITEARVVWSKYYRGLVSTFGCKFIRLSAIEKNNLLKFVEN